MKKRTLLSEVRNLQKIAGLLKENDQEGSQQVEKAFQKFGPTLLKALKMRTKRKEDIDAHDAVKASLQAIAKNLNLDPAIPYMENEMFSGTVAPQEAFEYAKEMFMDMLTDDTNN